MSGFKLHVCSSEQLSSGFVVDAANSDGSETRVTKTAVVCEHARASVDLSGVTGARLWSIPSL